MSKKVQKSINLFCRQKHLKLPHSTTSKFIKKFYIQKLPKSIKKSSNLFRMCMLIQLSTKNTVDTQQNCIQLTNNPKLWLRLK